MKATWDITTAAKTFNVTDGDVITATYTPGTGFLGSSNTVTEVVTKRSITVTSATNTKVYDGTTSAAAIPTITSGSLVTGNPEQPGDTAAFTEIYDTKNEGSGLTLTAAGSVNDGNGGNNYTVTFVTNTTGVIDTRAITVTSTTNTKVYDGTTSAAAIPAITFGSVQPGDTAAFTETYDTKNEGSGKTLTTTGSVNDGFGGADYTVTFVTNTTGVIDTRAITVTSATNTKVYDGTTSAAAIPTITFGSVQPGDTAAFTETYNTKNAGSGKTLTTTGSVNDGFGGDNYTVTFVTNTTGVIDTRAITVTSTTNTKVYDGTNSAAAIPTITFGTVQPGDTAAFTETDDTKNAGSGKTLTTTGSVNDGFGGADYTVTFITNTTGVIDTRAITVTSATNTKVYDGTPSAAAIPMITFGTVQPGDTAAFTETYDTKNEGSGKTLTTSGSVNDGFGGADYTVTFVTNTTGVINTRAITVTSTTNTKVYDGTTSAAAIPAITFGSVQPGNTAAFTETYDTKNAGSGLTLTTSGSVNDGFSGNDYTVTFVTNTTGVIDTRAITVTSATNTKVYDGTTSAAAIPMITFGTVQPGDTAAFTETYDTKNAGSGKTLTTTGSVNDGFGGDNYTVTFVTNTTGVIDTRAITVTSATNTKLYDGTTLAAAIPTITGGSLVTGDTADFIETYDTPSVGTGKTLTSSGSVTDGNDGNNYAVTFVTNTTGVIIATPVDIAVVVSDDSGGTTSGGNTSGGTATVNSLVTYSIVVTNTSSNAANGVGIVDDLLSSYFSGTGSYTVATSGGATVSTGGASPTSGNINENDADMPAGSSITYTLIGTVSSSATNFIVDTAAVNVPPGYTDTNTSNNSSVDTIALPAGVTIQTTSTSSVTPGTSITLTSVVTNTGIDGVTGVVVSNPVPSWLTGISYTSTEAGGAMGATASGTVTTGANIFDDTVNLPAGATITYTIGAEVASSATGTVTDTSYASTPAGVPNTDASAGYSNTNVSMDSVTLTPSADLYVAISGADPLPAGGTDVYTIIVTNNGPSDADGATLADAFDSRLGNLSVTSAALYDGAGVIAPTASGGLAGSTLNETLNMPTGSIMKFTVTGTLSSTASGTLSDTVTVADPIDSNLSNNTAVDNATITAVGTGSVVGTSLFYYDSYWDDDNTGTPTTPSSPGGVPPSQTDFAAAIAPDKVPLMPGQTTTYQNISSYVDGINGIFIDLTGDNLASISAADFEFNLGNTSTPGTGSTPGKGWSTLTTAPTVTKFAGQGINGSDLIALTWPSGAIVSTWLQVTVRGDTSPNPDLNTGLAQPDVFYLGSAPGCSGSSTFEYRVTAADEINARNDPHSTPFNRAPITDPNNFSRSSIVNAADEIIARNNPTGFSNALTQITVPGLPNSQSVSAPALSLSNGPATVSAPAGTASVSSVSSSATTNTNTATIGSVAAPVAAPPASSKPAAAVPPVIKVGTTLPPSPAPTGSISGNVFSDNIGNGKQDKAESGLAGWTINIEQLLNGQEVIMETAATNKNGDFDAAGLKAGSYEVTVVPQPGKYEATGNSLNGYHLSLGTGKNVTGYRFGEKPIA